ncbi:MAG: hypothetical protein ABR566_18370 [Pyrinomonadaceae bacterium]
MRRLDFAVMIARSLQINGSSHAESSDTLILPAAHASDALPTQILQNEPAQDKDQTNRTNRRLAVSERGRRMRLEP